MFDYLHVYFIDAIDMPRAVCGSAWGSPILCGSVSRFLQTPAEVSLRSIHVLLSARWLVSSSNIIFHIHILWIFYWRAWHLNDRYIRNTRVFLQAPPLRTTATSFRGLPTGQTTILVFCILYFLNLINKLHNFLQP